MKKQSRRAFVAAASVVGASMTVPVSSGGEVQDRKQLIHHVFFWLKNRGSREDLARLLEGLRTLEKIETIRKLHIGVPAGTDKRDVVDDSYSASELIFFDDPEGQKSYQDHPIHKKFIESCGHLWERVVVYDSMDV